MICSIQSLIFERMKRPPFLKKGSRIGLVAPARKITLNELKPAISIMEGWGLEVVEGKNLYNDQDQYSGSDGERISDMQEMLNDPSIHAVIAARGGYGMLRILDKLDLIKFRRKPKWILGYSDITILHSHLHKVGFETIHCTMPVNFVRDPESVESLRKALFGIKSSFEIPHHALNRKGKCEGQVIGGNLSLLYALQGSVSDITTKGKILFLEDLDEYLYHIDRMMISLKRSGKLGKLAGLVVGGMTEMKDNQIPFGKNAEEIIADAVKEYDYPVCFGFPAGHEIKNLALHFGRKARLSVGESGSSLKY